MNGGKKLKSRESASRGSLLWQLVLSPTRTSAHRMPVRIVQTPPPPPGSKWTTLTYQFPAASGALRGTTMFTFLSCSYTCATWGPATSTTLWEPKAEREGCGLMPLV